MRSIAVIAVLAMFAAAVAAVAAGDAVQPLPVGNWVGKRVLMVSAHPDDIEACAGGLIASLTAQGTEVAFLIVTNGDKGCDADFCANWTSPQLAVARATEAVNAAAVLGVPAANVFLLDYEDCMVTSYPEQQIRADVVARLRSWQPQVVMSWRPLPRFELLPSQGWADLGFHPDHQAVGAITLSAQLSSGVGRVFPGAGAAFHINEYYQWEFVQPTHFFALSNATLTTKINSWLQHKTQYPAAADVEALLTAVAERVGAIVGAPLAEGFLQYF